MKYTVVQQKAFLLLGVCRRFHVSRAKQEIPAFWDEYFRKGYGEIACGQFGCCFDERPDGTFSYAIGNFCTRDAGGKLHIFNRPNRQQIPEGFELLTVPAQTYLQIECRGPLPQSIQGTYAVLQKEWPAGWERIAGYELEEYGYCNSPKDAQKADYRCFIRIPVRMKYEIVSLRKHPDQLERFIAYFAKHWGKEPLYRDCMTASLATDSPLPQWFLAVAGENTIAGGAGLITNDFISRMDLSPWLCALYVEEEFRRQGLAGQLILSAAECAGKLGFPALYCCTDHTGFYERYGFSFIGTGYHPWDETSRIYKRTL